jgi:hypothetical protein
VGISDFTISLIFSLIEKLQNCLIRGQFQVFCGFSVKENSIGDFRVPYRLTFPFIENVLKSEIVGKCCKGFLGFSIKENSSGNF